MCCGVMLAHILCLGFEGRWTPKQIFSLRQFANIIIAVQHMWLTAKAVVIASLLLCIAIGGTGHTRRCCTSSTRVTTKPMALLHLTRHTQELTQR